MEKAKIERINFLARKSKNEGLTDAEKAEQKILRDEYREEFRRSLIAELDSIEFIDRPTGKES